MRERRLILMKTEQETKSLIVPVCILHIRISTLKMTSNVFDTLCPRHCASLAKDTLEKGILVNSLHPLLLKLRQSAELFVHLLEMLL